MTKLICLFAVLAALGMAQTDLIPAETPALLPTESPASAPWQPMSSSERWQQFVHRNFTGVGGAVRMLKSASFQQLLDKSPNWPRNGRGFGERLASNYAHNLIQDAITDGLAAALGEDTRYQRCECEGTWRRTRYALTMSFFTRNASDDKVFNYAKLAGIVASAMALAAWHPRTRSAFEQGAIYAGPSIGFEMTSSIAREFKPELKHLLRRK